MKFFKGPPPRILLEPPPRLKKRGAILITPQKGERGDLGEEALKLSLLIF